MNKSTISKQLSDFKAYYARLPKETSALYGKTKLFLDGFWCCAVYRMIINEYFEYEFYKMRAVERRSYVCHNLKQKFYRTLNDTEKVNIFYKKELFLERFHDYIGREWLDLCKCTDEELTAFVEKHPSCIAKPTKLSCGKGVRIVDLAAEPDILPELRKNGYLLEELIVQHPDMNKLNPSSVNTVRITTVNINGNVRIFNSALRCGQNGNSVDNFNAGGICASIDAQTGVVVSDGVDSVNVHYWRHPDSGVYFHGFQIPNWDKALETVIRAAKEIPEVRYVGWDVAIRENDVVFVEGNNKAAIEWKIFGGVKKDVEDLMNEVIKIKKTNDRM